MYNTTSSELTYVVAWDSNNLTAHSYSKVKKRVQPELLRVKYRHDMVSNAFTASITRNSQTIQLCTTQHDAKLNYAKAVSFSEE